MANQHKKNIEGNNNSDTFIWSSLPYIYVQQILNRRIISTQLIDGTDNKSAAFLFSYLIFFLPFLEFSVYLQEYIGYSVLAF